MFRDVGILVQTAAVAKHRVVAGMRVNSERGHFVWPGDSSVCLFPPLSSTRQFPKRLVSAPFCMILHTLNAAFICTCKARLAIGC